MPFVHHVELMLDSNHQQKTKQNEMMSNCNQDTSNAIVLLTLSNAPKDNKESKAFRKTASDGGDRNGKSRGD